jgi:putative phage-type endonuclease
MTVALSPLRTGRITGSRIGAILGLSKYSKRDEVLAEMVAQFRGQDVLFQGNEATNWGNEHERDAIEAYETDRKVLTHGGQVFVIHPEHDFLACTPDGLVGNDGLVEAKCPWSAQYTTVKAKPEYEAQIQLQLACTGRAWCDFLIWRQREPLIIERVVSEPGWLPRCLPVLVAFMDEYAEAIA